MRMTKGGRRIFVGELAMLMSCGRAFLGFVVQLEIVKMGRLLVMTCRGVALSSRLSVMLDCRMFR